MARIRTVKPELFRHELLYELEQESGLPIRVSFIALFTCCDRSGRFKWRPRQLKLDCAPYDDIDFSRVLDALWSRGFVVKYESFGEVYGCIKTFSDHQVINNREKESDIPSFDDDHSYIVEFDKESTRERRVNDASSTPLVQDQAEGEKEGKGREGKGILPASQKTKTDTSQTWKSYISAYVARYGVEPLRNAQTNSQMAKFCKSVALDEAPHIAEYFVSHNDQFFIKSSHSVGLLLQNAQKLRTEWATGRQMTTTRARQIDEKQTNLDAVQEAIRLDKLEGKI